VGGDHLPLKRAVRSPSIGRSAAVRLLRAIVPEVAASQREGGDTEQGEGEEAHGGIIASLIPCITEVKRIGNVTASEPC
jgi:hypothetical protein